jgi:hypothetical protein
VRKTTYCLLNGLNIVLKFELIVKIPEVSNKTQNLIFFEGFSQVFKAYFTFLEYVRGGL